MARWDWPGMFSAEIPETWQVREPDGLIELIPPSSAGAAQISVLARTKEAPVEPGESLQLVDEFANKQGANAVGELSEERRGDGFIARGWFSSVDSEGALFWDVQVWLWRDRALRCTYCHGGTDEAARSSAQKIFASIERRHAK